MIKLNISGGPEIVERLRAKGPQIVEQLTLQMTRSMIDVQSHIVGETLEQFFADGAPTIAATIRAIPAVLEGPIIHGEVEGGGPGTTRETLGGPNAGRQVDYALIQEEGVAHSWEIQPVLFASAQSILTKGTKERALAGTLPQALAFKIGGKTVIVRRVEHGPLRARPFMLAGLQDMEAKIIADLRTTLVATLNS